MPKFQPLLVLLLTFGFYSAISAQTTIFNIPSTDVMPESIAYSEADFISHFDGFERGGFQTFGYRTVYGVKRKFEVGANLFYTRDGSGRSMEVQPNVKWKVYDNEKYGLAVSTGALLYVPVKRKGARPFGMYFANASKVVKQAKGLRLTGGIYQIIGAQKDFGTKTGAMVGIEQPLRKRLIFIADWYSGKNRFGYSAAGLSFALTKRQYFTLGYNFGNSGRGNNALTAFYGFTY